MILYLLMILACVVYLIVSVKYAIQSVMIGLQRISLVTDMLLIDGVVFLVTFVSSAIISKESRYRFIVTAGSYFATVWSVYAMYLVYFEIGGQDPNWEFFRFIVHFSFWPDMIFRFVEVSLFVYVKINGPFV
jgi:hypothetical protein